MSSSRGDESGRIVTNESIGCDMMLEYLAASIIGGQVEGCSTILVSLTIIQKRKNI